ncbi:MAG TPA: hypothetical protein VM848_14585 [Acidimicrobiia bacterium]|nr:hypothetical protein [Acidimicrobiia bacterium]
MKIRKVVAAGATLALAVTACNAADSGDDGTVDTGDGGRLAAVSI